MEMSSHPMTYPHNRRRLVVLRILALTVIGLAPLFSASARADDVRDLLKLRETGTAKDISYLESVLSSNLPPTHIYPFAAAEALFCIGTPEAHQVLKRHLLTPDYNASQSIRSAFHWDMPEPQRSKFIGQYHLVNLAKDLLALIAVEPPSDQKDLFLFIVTIENYSDQAVQVLEKNIYLAGLLHFQNAQGRFVSGRQTVIYKVMRPQWLTLKPRESHTYRIEMRITKTDPLVLATRDMEFNLGQPGRFTVQAMAEQHPWTARSSTRENIENPWVGRAVSAGVMVNIPRSPLGVKLETDGTEISAWFVNDSEEPHTYKGGLGMRNSRHSCALTLAGADGRMFAADAQPIAGLLNYKDIVVPSRETVSIGQWDLTQLRYSEGTLVRGAGQLAFDELPPGTYQLHWWDGVFQLGAALRSVPVTVKVVQAIIDDELTELVAGLPRQENAAVRERIDALGDVDNSRRAKAAAELRKLLAADPSAAPNCHARAFWEARVSRVKPGMGKAAALAILLPDATAAEREQAWGSGPWSGRSGVAGCRLDDYWMVTLSLVDFDNQKIAPEPPPALQACVRQVWVNAPSDYTGAWATYFVNGQISHEIDYRNGKYHGRFTAYHDDGTKAFQQHYVDGVCHGDDTGWHRNGRVSYQGRYEQGKQVGRWRWWDENTKLTSERVFEDMSLADRVGRSDVIAMAKVDSVKVQTANKDYEYQYVTCTLTDFLKGKPVNNPAEVVLSLRLNQQPPPDRLLADQSYLVFLVGDWSLTPLTTTGSIIPSGDVTGKMLVELRQLVKQCSPIRTVGIHVVTPSGWSADTVIHSGGKVTGGHMSGGERPFHHMDKGTLGGPALTNVIAQAAAVFNGPVSSQPTIATNELVYITIQTFDREMRVYQRPIKGAFQNPDLFRLDELLHRHRIGAW